MAFGLQMFMGLRMDTARFPARGGQFPARGGQFPARGSAAVPVELEKGAAGFPAAQRPVLRGGIAGKLAVVNHKTFRERRGFKWRI